MSIRNLLLNAAFAFGVTAVAQQAPVIEWQRCLGGSGDDHVHGMTPTVDGGFVVLGTTYSGDGDITVNFGESDIWVVKLDENGEIEWQRTYGGSSFEWGFSIVQTNDNGFVIAGSTQSNDNDVTINNGGGDIWVVKLDPVGNIEWERSFGGSGTDRSSYVAQTNDGGYVVLGSTMSNDGDVTLNQGGFDLWVVKLDALGSILWQRTLGGTNDEDGSQVTQLADGGYLVYGSTRSTDGDFVGNHGQNDLWLVKLNSDGDILWQNALGGSSFEEPSSFDLTIDGGFILTGYTMSNNGDVNGLHGTQMDCWLVKVTASGDLEWQKALGGSDSDLGVFVTTSNDGGYLVSGIAYSNNGNVSGNHGGFGGDIWLVKLGQSGNVLWQKCFGGDNDEQGAIVRPTFDGDYVLVGSTSSSDGDVTCGNGGRSIWLLKATHNFNSIYGNVFIDLNSNLVMESDEARLSQHAIQTTNGSIQVSSGYGGYYGMSVFGGGSYSVQADPVQYYTAVPDVHTANFSGYGQIDASNDFAFQPLGTVNDLSISSAAISPIRPGFDAHFLINYRNVGTVSLAPSVVFAFEYPLTFLSASVTPTSVTADSIYWEVPSMQPFDEGNIMVTVSVDQNAVIGSIAAGTGSIYPIAGDATEANNQSYGGRVVTGSYDPNDIQVDRPEISPEELADGIDLTYLIRFQNTGTDTAFTVRVENPFPENADFDSFQVITTSHPVQVLYNTNNDWITFQFNNILLPDSTTNEPESHGYILYRIKPRSTLVLGDSVLNQVGIYFDYNLPIITNTAHTVIGSNIGLEAVTPSSSFSLHPNPTLGALLIRSLYALDNATLTLTDAIGRTLLTAQMNGSSHSLDLSDLPRGLYMVSLRDKEGVSQQQVVLE